MFVAPCTRSQAAGQPGASVQVLRCKSLSALGQGAWLQISVCTRPRCIAGVQACMEAVGQVLMWRARLG